MYSTIVRVTHEVSGGDGVHIDELRAQFGLSRKTIHAYVAKGLIPPPRGIGRWATYGHDHVEAIRAYQALRHNNTSMIELSAFLREEGISIVEYVRRRERAVRAYGLGLA